MAISDPESISEAASIVYGSVMHCTLGFAIENVAEPLVFVKKIHVEHIFSIKNRRL